MPQNKKWAIMNVEVTLADLEDIAKSIIEGTCMAVSDGSFKDKHGTACWILIGNGKRMVEFFSAAILASVW